jgi:ribA/ribD-fused uncharacterized protein
MSTILFYHEYEEFGWLSNYYNCVIEVDGKQWASTEHYYQAQKTVDTSMQNMIHVASTPDEAKRLGNSDSLVLRKDWNSHRIIAMRKALEAKFFQNSDLRALLIETADATLIENSNSDYYWGCGADGTGKNMLGLMLTHLRDEIRIGFQE